MLRRHLPAAALVLSCVAVVLSTTGLADAAKKVVRGGKVVRTSSNGKIASKLLPSVAPRARTADALGDQKPEDLADGCSPQTIDLGTWCLMASPYTIDNADIGKNDFFYASQKCEDLGGWLPTAAQLIGAAKRARLASVLTDSATNAAIDEEPDDGVKDRREMSSTLITTAAGSSAAGSQGVAEGSRGDPRTGEPDPVPQPANPAPDTLQYVTVYDNGDKGGFAGAKPVSDPERFRCAFGRTQGQATTESDG
ncbi:MAG TPA: hypothetical protein VNT55_19415 [Baekduia sp.]|nr:hypothetical protein [Baekduia sp.]